jgi:hypothetical protein
MHTPSKRGRLIHGKRFAVPIRSGSGLHTRAVAAGEYAMVMDPLQTELLNMMDEGRVDDEYGAKIRCMN